MANEDATGGDTSAEIGAGTSLAGAPGLKELYTEGVSPGNPSGVSVTSASAF